MYWALMHHVRDGTSKSRVVSVPPDPWTEHRTGNERLSYSKAACWRGSLLVDFAFSGVEGQGALGEK